MTLRPLIKHPGGKRSIADIAAELLGHPAELCEPFAGGLGVSIAGGMRPRFTAEAIPAIRALYNQLANDAEALFADLATYGEAVDDADAFLELRGRFNANPTPAGYMVLSASCFNGLARFNQAGDFNASPGKPMPRPIRQFDGEERAAYAERFEGCVCFEDWREAVAAAIAAGVPIYADPPYLDTFSYAGRWGLGDLEALADALPVGALVSERIVEPGAQTSMFEATAQQVLEARGFELVHTWTARDSISCGERTERPEGIWRKVAA